MKKITLEKGGFNFRTHGNWSWVSLHGDIHTKLNVCFNIGEFRRMLDL